MALDCCGDVVVYGRFFQYLSFDGQSGAELFSGIGRDFGHEYSHAAGVAGDFIPAFEKMYTLSAARQLGSEVKTRSIRQFYGFMWMNGANRKCVG